MNAAPGPSTKKRGTFVLIGVLAAFLFFCGLVIVCSYNTAGPGRHVMTRMESARNADTSNYDNVLKF
ncbi:MAG TPA: hypothetical protein V6D22_10725 [Candidatus Obscuribacterales bacterium]